MFDQADHIADLQAHVATLTAQRDEARRALADANLTHTIEVKTLHGLASRFQHEAEQLRSKVAEFELQQFPN